MLFAPRMWLFAIVSTLVGAFIAMEFWATSLIIFSPVVASAYEGSVLFLGIVMTCICFGMVGIYISWVLKYHYFFKLKKLLKASVPAGESIECQTPTGELYSIVGVDPDYTVTQSPREGSRTTVYYIGKQTAWALSVHKTTELTASDTYFGEREQINTTPVGLDKLRTFRHFSKVLEAHTSAHT